MPSREKWNSKFQIKKDTWVFVPTKETIDNGLKLKKLIEDIWTVPGHYYHLRRGGHVRALLKHLQNSYFIHLDIQNFFGQINRSRVTRVLKEHMPYNRAREIALESTVRLPDLPTTKYILPFGFVQSPIIASMCLRKSALGRHISRLASQKGFIVSVYMDDILVSSNNLEELKQQMVLINDAAIKSGLPLNTDKQEGPADCITAFNVIVSKGILKITPSRLEKFVDAFSVSTNASRRNGILSYVATVNSSQADLLRIGA